MYKIIIVIVAIAALLLLVALIILALLNWSEKIYGSALSVIAVTLSTGLVTIFLMLKEETFERNFTTLMVIDSKTRMPPQIKSSTNNNIVALLTEFSRNFTKRLHNPNDGTYKDLKIEPPKDDIEEDMFCKDLLQSKIMTFLISKGLNMQSMTHGVVDGTGFVSASSNKTFQLTDYEDKPIKDFEKELNKNRLFKAGLALFESNSMLTFKTPKGIDIEIINFQDTSVNSGQKNVLIIRKPYFFEIEISLLISLSTGPNSIPQELVIDPELVKNYKTRVFDVTMKAKFDKMTAGNRRTEELKEWTKFLFDEIEKKFTTSANSWADVRLHH
jgi:hypothetical protein